MSWFRNKHPGKYGARFMVPLGIDKTPYYNDRYFFVMTDSRVQNYGEGANLANKNYIIAFYAAGSGYPFGATMWNICERKDFSRNNYVKYKNGRKVQLLAYPGFDNWSYVGWQQKGVEHYGKGNNPSLI